MAADARGIGARLAPSGFFVISPSERTLPVASPWAFAERLLGEPVRMVERQVIRPVLGGRSFASSGGFTPLHCDLQLFLGAPADLQVMVCVEPAERGGASLLLDTWPLVERARRFDPALFEELVTAERHFPFVAGDVRSPTFAKHRDRVAFLHTPRFVREDPLAARVTTLMASVLPTRVDLRRGDTLVVDNHRVLHGREAFTDPRRQLVRFLIWTRTPRNVPIPLLDAACPRPVPKVNPSPDVSADELALVVAMLSGSSPGALAIKAGIPEPLLYELRDRAWKRAMAKVKPNDPAASGGVLR